MFTTFSEYEVKYSSIFTPFQKKLEKSRACCRRVVKVLDPILKGTDLLMKSFQYGVIGLSVFSTCSQFLQIPFEISKDIKNFSDMLKGVKSVDNILNFKISCRHITITLAGVTLTVLSVFTFIDRFKIFDISYIKKNLYSVPVFGHLPYGGLLPLSLIGIFSVSILGQLDQRKKMMNQKLCIQAKLDFWSQSITREKVQEKQKRYLEKISFVQAEIIQYEELIRQGMERKESLRKSSTTKSNELQGCEHVVKMLASELKDKIAQLKTHEEKMSQWCSLEQNWETAKKEDLNCLRQAKWEKWNTKLLIIGNKEKLNTLSLGSTGLFLAAQVVLVASAFFGQSQHPIIKCTRISLEVVGVVCSLMKYSLKIIKSPQSVQVSSYIQKNCG